MGVVSQQPPNIVAPLSLNFFANFAITSGVKSFLCPKNLLGVILTCISPENFEQNFNELKSLDVPCGFKFNAFENTQPKDGYTTSYGKSNGNPNEFLGQRKDLTPEVIAKLAKEFFL